MQPVSPPLKDEIQHIWDVLATVEDPEIPVLSVLDLGIVRDVRTENEFVIVDITPTYSGCPAMDMISVNIRLALMEAGYQNIKISFVLSPAWTTNWMTDAGRKKLLAYGIAPPMPASQVAPACPQCGAAETKLLSQFGSTACKSLWQCDVCKEPFDHFKCH